MQRNITAQAKMKLSPFQTVAVGAALIVVARMAFPQLLFDNQSLILCGIGAVAYLLPRLLEVLPPMKKVKIGEFEAEFDKAIKELEERVVEAETKPVAPASQWTTVPPMREDYVKEYNRILSAQTSNAEKILSAAILVERMVSETSKELEIDSKGRRMPAMALIRELAGKGFVSDAEKTAFEEFWKIRNAVVHGQFASPTDIQTARVLDLLWRLVRTFA